MQGIGKNVCGFDLEMRINEATGTRPGSKMFFTELDINDPDVNSRADGYEHSYLAGYMNPNFAGIFLWG